MFGVDIFIALQRGQAFVDLMAKAVVSNLILQRKVTVAKSRELPAGGVALDAIAKLQIDLLQPVPGLIQCRPLLIAQGDTLGINRFRRIE